MARLWSNQSMSHLHLHLARITVIRSNDTKNIKNTVATIIDAPKKFPNTNGMPSCLKYLLSIVPKAMISSIINEKTKIKMFLKP
mmetsp:Transcript_17231/g.19945  ORF Transcript_17231/g.19945 Transcript_17231/m.19945 type:complete len:84 (-) Transcript_17231:637-888(-)